MSERRTRWISQGLEALFEQLQGTPDTAWHFDVLIVGSGYGGAVAADRLAGLQRDGRPWRVAVLERGREYLAGAFPSRTADLAGHVRFTTPGANGARGRLEGLFDVRIGAQMSVLVANGVGGGSLINAGVMEPPTEASFARLDWPASWQHDELYRRALELRAELGAGSTEAPNVVRDDSFGAPLARTRAMRRLGGDAHREVAISVALRPNAVNAAGVSLDACTGCGDCATGCNHGAKDSLDLNLLHRAVARGVQVFSSATVTRLQRHTPPGEAEAGWQLDVWHTDATLRARMAGPLRVRARRVVLAAGALGSTELLLRSQSSTLRWSPTLGRGFSGNGDALAALHDADAPLDGVADEGQAPRERGVGPTITGMIDLRDSEADCVLQDLGIPAPLRRLFEETTTTAAALHRLEQPDDEPHDPDDTRPDPCAVDPAVVRRSMCVALIGHDNAAGVLSAVPDDSELPADAGVRIEWPAADKAGADAAIARGIEALRRLSGATLRAQVLPNPLWQPLPSGTADLLQVPRGPLLTVHPLGGCRMAADRTRGVVDALGRVYDAGAADPTAVHDGLVVLDGAIVPGALGINPGLTIAALADGALARLLDTPTWGGTHGRLARAPTSEPESRLPAAPQRRPVFRPLPPAQAPAPTLMQVVERLTGQVQLDGRPYWLELSLAYEPTALRPRDRAITLQGITLTVDRARSRLRVFEAPPEGPGRDRGDTEALLVAEVAGTLRFGHREASTAAQRRRRALAAWWVNRGARDLYQSLLERLRGERSWSSATQQARPGVLASRAGGVRRFDYTLDLLDVLEARGPFEVWRGRQGLAVHGAKRLTYERQRSPLTQLTTLALSHFGGLRLDGAAQLTLDLHYFTTAHTGVPLLRVDRQQDLPTALIDVASFGLYFARVLLELHTWSARKPDTPAVRVPRRLPGAMDGLPKPEVHEIEPDDTLGGVVRLTRYPGITAWRPPVLMVHGFSASGTTFAHPRVDPNLARHLWSRGFEPWIVDLRTSCGMPTATLPWTFNQIAAGDLPAAVRHVCRVSGHAQIDVVSHCMGSAMLALAMLRQSPDAFDVVSRVRRWVMSQVGPAMLLTPANLARGHFARMWRHLLPSMPLQFRPPDGEPGFLDRLLSALPYLDDPRGSEFLVENPPPSRFWRHTPWVATRHRLDALVGRTFDARRMSRAVLAHIDDFFGPVNVQTLTQPIDFAQRGFVADPFGHSVGRDESSRLRLAGIQMLSLHALDNGLADPGTWQRMRQFFDAQRFQLRTLRLRDRGHQDSLIGRDCGDVLQQIHHFLVERQHAAAYFTDAVL